MHERSARPDAGTRRTCCGNSAHIETARIAVQLALGKGGQINVADSLAGIVCLDSVREQIEAHGNKRISATVLFAGLANLPMGQRLPIMQNLAGPLGFIVSIAQTHQDGDPLACLALAVAEVGDVSRAILEAIIDGSLDSTERAHVVREIAEAKAALTHLEKVVSK